ncbi:MAG: TIGR03617 family F420-dependent LLM class oxidoreductase [Solirubrobacterales bacterium]
MQLDLALPLARSVDVREASRRAEAAGFAGGWVSEVAHDPFLALALAAPATSRLGLGTAVAIAFARNPMSVAIQADDLQALSGGRLRLGLGTQVKAHVTRRFAMPWDRPVERMRDFVGALRAIWAAWDEGAALDFRSDFGSHTLMPPAFVPARHGFGPPPVLLAGVGPRMTAMAGAVADGFITHAACGPTYLREVTLPALRRGRGGGLDGFEVVVTQMLASGRDEAELAAASERVRAEIAFYGSTAAYREVLAVSGRGAVADSLHLLARAGGGRRWRRWSTTSCCTRWPSSRRPRRSPPRCAPATPTPTASPSTRPRVSAPSWWRRSAPPRRWGAERCGSRSTCPRRGARPSSGCRSSSRSPGRRGSHRNLDKSARRSDMEFEGRTVFITGGARGQGRSHAVEFARRGADVVLCDICAPVEAEYPPATPADLEETKAMVEAEGRRCLAQVADVRLPENMARVVAEAEKALGGIDILVANAGILNPGTRVDRLDPATFANVVQTNLMGVFHAMSAVLPGMLERGSGRIIAISSMAGRRPYGRGSAYCSSKWGVIGLVKDAAIDLAREGITVNAVCPCSVDTPMAVNDHAVKTFRPDLDDPQMSDLEEVMSRFHPQGIPWVEPADVTATVVFLAGAGARYITGDVFTVGAGMMAMNVA